MIFKGIIDRIEYILTHELDLLESTIVPMIETRDAEVSNSIMGHL
jgi:hypothetical protein